MTRLQGVAKNLMLHAQSFVFLTLELGKFLMSVKTETNQGDKGTKFVSKALTSVFGFFFSQANRLAVFHLASTDDYICLG